MIITVATKPEFGRFTRDCLNCGAHYFGYNVYVCQECESRKQYTIVEEWANGN